MKCFGILVVWFSLAHGLIALACHGVAAFVRLLARLQSRTGLAKTGRGEPSDLIQQIQTALPLWAKVICWTLAFLLTCLLYSGLYF